MPTRKGFLQGYNAQLAVSADQVIVAVRLARPERHGMLRADDGAQRAAASLHAKPAVTNMLGIVLADAGYGSDRNLAAPDQGA